MSDDTIRIGRVCAVAQRQTHLITGVLVVVRPGGQPTAESGSVDVIAELVGLVDDVDAEHDGRTALWVAVQADMHDNARVLAAAGERMTADDGRLVARAAESGQRGFRPFTAASASPGLAQDESAAVTQAHRLIDALRDFDYDGLNFTWVAGVDAAEAV
ncbi:hypothetical protein [Micromonospora sp. NPDC049679]|uniref:hypothetical protein n=1 Tax=Micromonospora sp. NPDC049679 TaxID=3155920 RepID=UPI0034065DE7